MSAFRNWQDKEWEKNYAARRALVYSEKENMNVWHQT